MEAQSHGWDQQGNPWYTQPVSMTYTTPNISGDGGGGAFTALLDKKVKEATEAMRMEMNSKLFGKPTGNPELRKCIADAVDQYMPAYRTQYKQEYPPHLKDAKPKYKTATEAAIMAESKAQLNRVEANLIYGLNTNNIIWGQYKDQITENIFKESPILGAIKAEKENAVSDDYAIAAKAAEKRKEAKAEAIIDIVGDYFESTDWVDGNTVSWAVEFHDSPGKTYHYVTVRGGNNWYITADSKTYSTDKIVEHITYLALRGYLTSEDFDVT